MGGLVCRVPWRALVRFETVPAHADDQRKLEAELRQAFSVPSIYEAVVEKGLGEQVCAVLANKHLSVTDLTALLNAGDAIYAMPSTKTDS